MKQQDDFSPLGNLLHRTRLNAPINPSHKAQLREKLLATPPQEEIFRKRMIFATSFAMVLMTIGIFWMQDRGPLVGSFIWNVNQSSTESLRAGKWLRTGNDRLTAVLQDRSSLQFEPLSEFKILSSSTKRRNEEAVIFLKRGEVNVDVKNKMKYPLIIHTPDAKVRVVGTKFSVTVKEINK